MSRTYLLDTSTASYVIKDRPPQARRKFLRAVVESEVCISAVTGAELRYGQSSNSVRFPDAGAFHRRNGTFHPSPSSS